MFRLFFVAVMLGTASAFAPIATHTAATATTSLRMMDVGNLQDVASSGMLLAETEAWVQPLSLVLDPFLNLLSFAMVRVVCTSNLSGGLSTTLNSNQILSRAVSCAEWFFLGIQR